MITAEAASCLVIAVITVKIDEWMDGWMRTVVPKWFGA